MTDQYGWVDLEWDFTNGTCSSWYNGVLIDDEFSLIEPPADPAPLTSFNIKLTGNNAGGEVVWVDNFFLQAVKDDYEWIWYEYFDENNLLLCGALDGQGLPGMGHWEAGADNPVPIPGAAWLLGSGIIVLIGIRRKRA